MSRKTLSCVALLVCFFFVVGMFVPSIALATGNDETFLVICEGNGCKKPRRGREDRASHIAFTTKKAKELLKEVKDLRGLVKVKSKLTQRKINLKDQEIKLYAMQTKQANKTVSAQGKRIVNLQKKNDSLSKENTKLILDVAKYKGQRSKFLIIGFSVGVGLVLVGGVVIAVVMK